VVAVPGKVYPELAEGNPGFQIENLKPKGYVVGSSSSFLRLASWSCMFFGRYCSQMVPRFLAAAKQSALSKGNSLGAGLPCEIVAGRSASSCLSVVGAAPRLRYKGVGRPPAP